MCRPVSFEQGELCMTEKVDDVSNVREMALLTALGLIGAIAGIATLLLTNL